MRMQCRVRVTVDCHILYMHACIAVTVNRHVYAVVVLRCTNGNPCMPSGTREREITSEEECVLMDVN